MSQLDLFDKALQLTRECIQLVHQGDFDQFLVLENERRSAMKECLQSPAKDNLAAMQELHKANQALERELEEVLGALPASNDNPYDRDDTSGGYSVQA